MPVVRDDEEVVRQVLESILPDNDERRICLDFMAEAVRTASQLGDGLWSLSLRNDPDGIRLNVGRIEICNLGRSGRGVVTVTVHAPTVPADLLEELTQEYNAKPFAAVPETVWSQIPAARFCELASQLLGPCLEAITLAARSVRVQTPYHGAHSPGAVAYLQSETGQKISPPIYSTSTDGLASGQVLRPDKTATLIPAFDAFRNDPLEKVRVRVRRMRATQIRELLSNSNTVDLDTFNREVWQMESAVMLDGHNFKGRIMSATPLTSEEIKRLNEALDQDRFEFHGNSVWGSGSGVLGPTEPDPEKRQKALSEAMEALNDGTLSPEEKVEYLLTIPGFGANTATGLVMLFHPTEYALKNNESIATLGKLGLGYPINTPAAFQQSAKEVKELVGAEDFLELDLFLYRYARRDTGNKVMPTHVQKLATVTPPSFWWVCQGGTYEPERAGGYVWAPQFSKKGTPLTHHVNVFRLDVGDIVIHYAKKMIRALGVVTAAPVKAPRPAELPEGEWKSAGYFAKIEYHEIIEPIGLEEIPVSWRRADVGPFDKNGDVNQGYLYSVTPDFAAKLSQQFADRLPTLRTPSMTPSSETSVSSTLSPLPRRIVKIAPGPNGSFWDECLEGGYICVGWDEVGDLKQYPDRAALFEAFEEQGWYKTGSKRSTKVNELWTLRELEPGDVVVANRGVSEVLGVGRVIAPGYVFRDDRTTFKHTVSVEWNTSIVNLIPKQGSWPMVTVAPVSPELYRYIIRESTSPPLSSLSEPDQPFMDPYSESENDPVPSVVEAAKVLPTPDYIEPIFDEIRQAIHAQKLRIPERDLRRYHLSLKTRGFVVLSGLSGTGKTWLAQAYAEAVGAKHLLVPVAPNWTTNEDLLGYHNPISCLYQDTEFSRFLRWAGKAYQAAQAAGRTAQPYHLILDEMNLARVEYYFARFLSAMEVRARSGFASMELAAGDNVLLPPNFMFVGTVNMDETTHSFADKVYDRAQLIELGADRDSLALHLAGLPHADLLIQIWDAVNSVAPFAFRVLDEISAYIAQAEALQMNISWEEALDEQLLQKVLPKLKGAEPRVGTALMHFCDLTRDVCPLSYNKANHILEGYRAHGIASYF